jgi:peroxiredoxin
MTGMNRISIFSAVFLILVLLIGLLSCSRPAANIPAVSEKQPETKTSGSTLKPAEIKAVEEKEVPRLKAGDKAPLFTLADVDGKTVSLADFQGKKVIINMLWLQCHGCVDEMPYFQEFFQAHPDVPIVAISVYDSENMLKAFGTARGLTFSLLVDPGKNLNKSYIIAGVPTTFFIDQSGIIKAIKDGSFENAAEIESILNSF